VTLHREKDEVKALKKTYLVYMGIQFLLGDNNFGSGELSTFFDNNRRSSMAC
jgi:hypothetical protein